jgi:glycosyltransferase involved in cell wall biosynthesis
MPKILRIVNRLNIGGPVHNVAYLTKHLAPRFETHLIAGQLGAGEQSAEYLCERLGIKPVYIPTMQRNLGWKQDQTAFKFLRKYIRQFKPDIVHTHAAKAGALGRLAAWLEKVPVIVHTFHGHVFHSYFSKWKTWIFKNIERFLAQRSHAIIAVSDTQKHELANVHKICSADKIKVVYNGFDLEIFNQETDYRRSAFRQKWMLNENDIAIGLIGRMAPIKNYPFFIEVIAKLIPEYPQLKVFLVGDGEERLKIEALLKEKQLDFDTGSRPAAVNLTSWQPEIEKVLPGLDIVCLTSKNEGTPVSLIEAQAAGKPVVATDVGGTCDVVKANESGFLIPANDTATFIDKLNLLIQSPEMRFAFGTAGKNFVFNRFTYQRLVADMEKLYNELLSKR